MNIPFSVTVTCPETGIPITAQPHLVQTMPDGRQIALIKCLHCDAYGYFWTHPNYNGNVPQAHYVEIIQE